MSKWDVYYYMTFILEETGKAPTSKQINEKFKHYDKEMVKDGMRMYKRIQAT